MVIPENLGGVRRVPAENLHVTLAFLGYTADERLPEVASAAASAAAEVDPFRLAFAAAGRFPERGRPRVLWLAVAEGRETLLALGSAVARELRVRGLRFDDRPLSPHLTLARLPDTTSSADARAVAAAVDALRPPRLETEVREILVMRSDLSRKGPTYTPQWQLPLGGRGPG